MVKVSTFKDKEYTTERIPDSLLSYIQLHSSSDVDLGIIPHDFLGE